MKKRFLASVLLVCIVFFAFGDTKEQEEIDYLLFVSDSGSLFVNEEQAQVQLDNLAKYLTARDLSHGQIYVYGYAAFAENDIEPVSLSRDRAFWVINELKKRGVPQHLFSDPVGHGSVDLWGSNEDEEGRIPNRRVRIILDGNVLTPETLKAAEPEIEIVSIDNDEDVETPIKQESAIGESKPFPWWILLLLPLLALIFLLLKKKKSAGGKTAAPQKAEEPKPAPVPAPAAASKPVKPIITSTFTVNLEEEIRFRAYELYLRRNGYSEDHYEDWCRAVLEISAKYEADGFQVYHENENWWARKFTYSS
ncbi:MAG: OmpA family protein [Treponema sp.]|nr:OmpA family protein [Treponema sp.]